MELVSSLGERGRVGSGAEAFAKRGVSEQLSSGGSGRVCRVTELAGPSTDPLANTRETSLCRRGSQQPNAEPRVAQEECPVSSLPLYRSQTKLLRVSKWPRTLDRVKADFLLSFHNPAASGQSAPVCPPARGPLTFLSVPRQCPAPGHASSLPSPSDPCLGPPRPLASGALPAPSCHPQKPVNHGRSPVLSPGLLLVAGCSYILLFP